MSLSRYIRWGVNASYDIDKFSLLVIVILIYENRLGKIYDINAVFGKTNREIFTAPAVNFDGYFYQIINLKGFDDVCCLLRNQKIQIKNTRVARNDIGLFCSF